MPGAWIEVERTSAKCEVLSTPHLHWIHVVCSPHEAALSCLCGGVRSFSQPARAGILKQAREVSAPS